MPDKNLHDLYSRYDSEKLKIIQPRPEIMETVKEILRQNGVILESNLRLNELLINPLFYMPKDKKNA